MRSTRDLCFFVYSLLVIAVTGTTILCSAQERQMGGVGITVFADQNFRGKSATFRQDVTNLDPIGLNDKRSVAILRRQRLHWPLYYFV